MVDLVAKLVTFVAKIVKPMNHEQSFQNLHSIQQNTLFEKKFENPTSKVALMGKSQVFIILVNFLFRDENHH